MPVLPLVESIRVRLRSSGSASWMMRSAARSLTDPPGLNHSSLAWISTPGGSSERSRTTGVFPTAWVRESRINGPAPRGWRPAPPGHPPPLRRRGGRSPPPPRRTGRSRARAFATPRARRARPPPPARSRSRPDTGRPRARNARCRGRGTTPRPACPDRSPRAGDGARTSPVARRSASARDRRHDGEPVAFLERGGEPLGVADVLVVAEDVHVPAQRALVVEQLVLDAGVLARELVDRGLHAG